MVRKADDLAARIVEALARAQGFGVGCAFWLEPEFDLSLEVLSNAGLVKPFRQRVPPCEEHGCHLLGRCPEEDRFRHVEDMDREGVSNRKFRLTQEGLDLLAGRRDAMEAMRRAATASDLASAALRIIARSGREGIGSLELLGRLLREQEQHLEAHGEVPFELDRWELGQWLKLMEAAGLVRADDGFRRIFPGPALQGILLG